MTPSDVVFDYEIPNRNKFGHYVRERRKELNMSLRYLAGELNITPAYVSDIERGNRQAPIMHLEDFVDILQIEQDEVEFFYDIAGCSHSNWQDLNQYLFRNPSARKAIRIARDRNNPEEQFFNAVIAMIKEKQAQDMQCR